VDQRCAHAPYKKAFPYEIYNKLASAYTKRKTGDCYDRFLVADREMRQSITDYPSMYREST